MDVNSRNRTELKSYFLKNSIPTESNFAELIDGLLNQKDDGVVKLPGNPLSIEAAGDDNSPKKVINFYRNFTAAQPDWTISLNPWANANDPATARAGFAITDGEGNNRLFIDRSTGHLGVKTTRPKAALDIKADTTTAGGWFEAIRLSQDDHSAITHPGGGLLLGLHGNRSFYFGDIKDGVIQKYVMVINAESGNVGIGTDNPKSLLDVNGDTNIKGTLRFSANANQSIYGAKRIDKDTVVLKGNWDELEVKGRVIEWTGSNLHIGYENDHTGHAVYIGNGKLDKVEIQGSTNLVVGGDTTTTGLAVVGNRTTHWDTDGAIYRYGGQMYITVDDNLYIRDAGGDIKFHFDTNNGIINQEGWQTIQSGDFKNNWVNYGHGYNNAGYFKDRMGIVHLRGLVRGGFFGWEATIFILPVGYRPQGRELQIVCSSSSYVGLGRVDILTDGRVIPVAGDAGWFSLDGVTFRAA